MASLAQFLQLAFVGVVSGLFSAMLAHRAHQQKRWWDLRVTAYQDLIYALSDLCYYYRQYYEAYSEQRDLSDEFTSKLTMAWNDGYPKVRRAADAGAFLFSANVSDALLAFRQKNDLRYDTYFDHLEVNFVQAEKCLKTVVEESKRDLQLSWWTR